MADIAAIEYRIEAEQIIELWLIIRNKKFFTTYFNVYLAKNRLIRVLSLQRFRNAALSLY